MGEPGANDWERRLSLHWGNIKKTIEAPKEGGAGGRAVRIERKATKNSAGRKCTCSEIKNKLGRGARKRKKGGVKVPEEPTGGQISKAFSECPHAKTLDTGEKGGIRKRDKRRARKGEREREKKESEASGTGVQKEKKNARSCSRDIAKLNTKNCSTKRKKE